MSPPTSTDIAELTAPSPRKLLLRLTAFFAVVLLAGIALFATGWHKQVSLESIVNHRTALAALVDSHPLSALVSFVAGYAVASGLALPGVMFITIAGGVFFGGALGGVAAIAGATLGATAVFLAVKFALRSIASRLIGPRIGRFVDGFRKNAFSYLLFLRLVPIFPFTLGNAVPALCNMRLGTFMAATCLGIAPMTLAVAYFGEGLDSVLAVQIEAYQACITAANAGCTLAFSPWMAITPELVVALIALGLASLLPVFIKRFIGKFAPMNGSGPDL